MRRVRAGIAVGGYQHDVFLRLYGPDAAGALDTSAAVALGRAPAFWHASAGEFQEEAFQSGAHQGPAAAAGFQEVGFQEQALYQEQARAELLGSEHDFAAVPYAARAFDEKGNASSASPTSGKVLVVSQPAAVVGATISINAGRVRMTVESAIGAG